MRNIISKYQYFWLIAIILSILITAPYLFKKRIIIDSKNSPLCRTKIIPHPQEIGYKEALHNFIIDSNTVIVILKDSVSYDAISYDILNAAVSAYSLPPLKIIDVHDFKGKKNAIVIGQRHKLLDSLVLARNMLTSPPYLRDEEYRLDVNSGFIVLLGQDKAAIFWGVQTLIQLFQQDTSSHKLKVPAVRIVDFPDMPLRTIFYGFHFQQLDNAQLIKRGYKDIQKFAKYKFNMIGLDNQNYSHLEMKIPDGIGEKYWQRFLEIFNFCRKYHLRPMVGGLAQWYNIDSPWGADPTTLEGIRTTYTFAMVDKVKYPLKISTGHIAYKVIHNFKTGKSWRKEPVVVTDESGHTIYEEDIDYKISFGKMKRPYYEKVIYGEGEPVGFPLRRGESTDEPTLIWRTDNSRIQDGQTVKVTFSYIGPDPWSRYKIRYCRSDSRIHIDGPDNFIWRWCTQPVTYLHAKLFNIEMDEVRVFAWDKRCLDSGKSRSQIFADDIKYYYDTIKKKQPQAQIFMWSDMLDPSHNAVLYKTEGITDILLDYGLNDIVMIPWYDECAKRSIDFFAGKGFSIMAFSQAKQGKFSVAPFWAKLLRDKFSHSDKPYGLMHGTWEYDYDTEEGMERLATAADHAWSVAPYIVHLPINKAPAGENILIKAEFEGDRLIYDGDKIVPGPLPLTSAYVYFRLSGQSRFQRIKMKKQRKNSYIAIIPALYAKSSGAIEYYIEMRDKFNSSLSPKSAPAIPYKITIT